MHWSSNHKQHDTPPVEAVDGIQTHDIYGMGEQTQKLVTDVIVPAVTVAASTVPAVGEAMDIATLLSQDSTPFEKTMAGFSLLLSAVSAGLTPNFGTMAKAGNKAIGNTVDVTRAANHASDLRTLNNIPASNSQTAMRSASEAASTKGAGNTLVGCFVAGTQVVIVEEATGVLFAGVERETPMAVDTQTASLSSVVLVAMGLLGVGKAITTRKRGNRKESNQPPADEQDNEPDQDRGDVSLAQKNPPQPISRPSQHHSGKGKKTMQRPLMLIASLLLVLFGLWGMFAPSTTHTPAPSFDSAATLTAASHQPATEHSQPKYLTKNIEDLTVGLVIPAHNPEGGETDELNLERPNAATWRKLSLISPKRDGTMSEITLLRPLWWLEDQQAQIGSEVWVEVPECGISGWAKLLAVEPCPTIDDKDGEVVTGTFKHHVASVLDIWIEGEPEPVGTTPNHPLWCEEENTFVRADALQVGSTLRLLDLLFITRSSLQPQWLFRAVGRRTSVRWSGYCCGRGLPWRRPDRTDRSLRWLLHVAGDSDSSGEYQPCHRPDESHGGRMRLCIPCQVHVVGRASSDLVAMAARCSCEGGVAVPYVTGRHPVARTTERPVRPLWHQGTAVKCVGLAAR